MATRPNMFNVYSSGRVEIPFGAMHGIFDDEANKESLLQALNSIGLNLPTDSVDRYPSIQIPDLLTGSRLDGFLSVWEDQIRLVIRGGQSTSARADGFAEDVTK